MKDFNAFEKSIFQEDEEGGGLGKLGNFAVFVLHGIALLFVIYSALHNGHAALAGVKESTFMSVLQVVGVVSVLELSIIALHFAIAGSMFTGTFQLIGAVCTWAVGILMSSAGIVADSRIAAGQPLSTELEWYLSTGLYLAPVVMMVGIFFVIMADPMLQQRMKNAHSRAVIARDKVVAEVQAQKAAHASQKMVASIKLTAQKQAVTYAQEFYKTPQVQEQLKQYAIGQMADTLREAGINVDTSAQLPAPVEVVAPDATTSVFADTKPTYTNGVDTVNTPPLSASGN